MMRTYDYEGYTLEVSVESDADTQRQRSAGVPVRPGYVAIVRIFLADRTLAVFSPLRFGEISGRPFTTEVDALMGGYSAARKIVDDLFCHDPG